MTEGGAAYLLHLLHPLTGDTASKDERSTLPHMRRALAASRHGSTPGLLRARVPSWCGVQPAPTATSRGVSTVVDTRAATEWRQDVRLTTDVGAGTPGGRGGLDHRERTRRSTGPHDGKSPPFPKPKSGLPREIP